MAIEVSTFTVGATVARTGQFFRASSRGSVRRHRLDIACNLEAQRDVDEPPRRNVLLLRVHDHLHGTQVLAFLAQYHHDVVGEAGGQRQGEEVRGSRSLFRGIGTDEDTMPPGVLSLE